MYDSQSKGISYTAGFFILIGFTVAGLLLATIISIPVWTAMTGRSFAAMQKEMDDPANGNAVKAIQCIQAVIGFFLPAILTAFLLNRRPMRLIGFQGKISWKQAGLVIVIIIAALYVSSVLSYVNEMIPVSESMKHKFEKMESDYERQMEAIIGLNNFGEYLLALVIIAFLPALCEETLFRGGLQNFLARSTKKPWLAIIVVSILFSAAHFSYYGFLSRFFLGVILGLLYEYSGRIWLNILAHFLNNALALTVLYFYKSQGKSMKETLNDSSPVALGILALPVLIGLLYLFHKISIVKKESLPFSFEEENKNPSHGL
jgi:uncharacterized protein